MMNEKLRTYERVCASVNLDNIRDNCIQMKKNMHDETQMIGVIKADGYGHGAVPIAHELQTLDFIYGFATATVEEAMILRRHQVTKPILILGYTFPYCYETLVNEQIRSAVFRMDQILELQKTAKDLNKVYPVHVKVDTGMSRIGIQPNNEGIAFIKEILTMPNLKLEGIFTHFARADEAEKTAAIKQFDKFQAFVERIKEELHYDIPCKHCSNSASIVELQNMNLDIVRAGITLYGLWPSDEVKRDIVPLKPALELHSHIVYVKELEPGREISYGGTFTVKEKMRVATIPVGYADGYPRSLSNKGYVLICGKKASILGRICMDQFMVDVTDIADAKEGSIVTLIGRDGENEITMELLGDISGRFNYELACDLGKRIPRVYLKNGEVVETKDYYNE